MSLIWMIGPSGVGKTTAIERWSNRYSRLVVVNNDHGWVWRDGRRFQQKDWCGTDAERSAVLSHYRDLDRVVVLEMVSYRANQLLPFWKSGETVIVLTCPPALLKSYLVARALDGVKRSKRKRGKNQRAEVKKRKRFRWEYWTDKKLEYEGSRRITNLISKYLRADDVAQFEIRDRERDWKVVDAYFARIHARLNNHLNRL